MSAEARSSRFDDGDQRNQAIEEDNSGGRETTRLISRERVSRMLSLDGRIVATYAPSGLGRDCEDAKFSSRVSNHLRHSVYAFLHFRDREKRILISYCNSVGHSLMF